LQEVQSFKTKSRIDDIEILRGIAASMVLISHFHLVLVRWPLPAWQNFTAHYADFWTGVDLFFAISGFVIARSLLPGLARAQPAGLAGSYLASFWVRRAWRLWPTAWLWLFVMLVQAQWFNRADAVAGDGHLNAMALLAGIAMVANFRHALVDIQSAMYGISGHYWSLSFEEQFYFLLPLVVLACRRRLTTVLTVACALSFLLPVHLSFPFFPHPLLWGIESPFFFYFRPQALLAGVLLAMIEQRGWLTTRLPAQLRQNSTVRRCLFALGMLGLIAAAPIGRPVGFYLIDIIALSAMLLVGLAAQNRDDLPLRGGARRPLLWLGSRSYAIYVIHMPVFFATREIWSRLMPGQNWAGLGWAAIFAATAVLALGPLAELNYRYVEMPLRRYGARLADAISWSGSKTQMRASET